MKQILILFCVLFPVFGFTQNKNYIKTPSVTFKNKLNTEIRNNWQHLDIEKDTIPGTSLNRVYKEIIKNKRGKEIIVAVIDNYMDIHHEDLKETIWINKKEIPNNGLDDDKNGYVDDINGWNFLGVKGGNDLEYANSESTRILRMLQKKHSGFTDFKENRNDLLLFIKTSKKYDEDKSYLIDLRNYVSENISNYRKGEKLFYERFHKTTFQLADFDSLYIKNSSNDVLKKSIWFMRNMYRLGKNLEILKIDSLKIEDELKYTYGESFYDRKVLGDNEFDLNDI